MLSLRSEVQPSCARFGRAHVALLARPNQRGFRRKALPLEHLPLLHDFVHHLPLAWERVVYPCSSINCGDVIYRSTLDPALRMEDDGINPAVWFISACVLAYLTATPGPLQATWDMYIVAPFINLTSQSLRKKDVEVGRKLAQGGFGTVYMGKAGATIPGKIRKGQSVVVKKATEFGEAEVWMNERLTRACPQACATFLTAYPDGPARIGTPLVLVWKFEGKLSLFEALQVRNFPLNIEEELLGRQLRVQDTQIRSRAIIQVIMRQILQNLSDIHNTGIVHRDVKPQNMIISPAGIKMIDLGAAADLRIGINYVPNEYLLDPRYAPPEQFIMSPLTPKAPPTPVAALLSPVLWTLNQPDRFDIYSAGIVLMQLAFPNLRSDSNLIAFRNKLEDCDHDISRWRETVDRKGSQYAEGFALLDAQGGWDLVRKMLEKIPSKRLSAKQAMQHMWLKGQDNSAVGQVAKRINTVVDGQLEQLAQSLPTRRESSLSEAELYSALQEDDTSRPEALQPSRNMPRTVAWWQERSVRSSYLKQADSDGVLANLMRGQGSNRIKPTRGAAGFATQRAMGLAKPDDRKKNSDETKSDETSREKQPVRSGLFSILNKD